VPVAGVQSGILVLSNEKRVSELVAGAVAADGDVKCCLISQAKSQKRQVTLS
jgi:hypothetical protein